MPDAVVVIPARWASSRFPGKVLAPLDGRALVLRACDLAARARRPAAVIVATDDERVAAAVGGAGYRCEPTRADHPSGTDRIAEVAARLAAEVVVGLQADEPFLAPEDLDAMIAALDDPGTRLATLAAPLADAASFRDPNVVKVVLDGAGRALYFSRSPIPYPRPPGGALPFPPGAPHPATALRHVGVYAWQRESLLAFAGLSPSPLERAEGLEQLRALEAGWTIRVLPAHGDPAGIDTPEDLRRAELRLARERTR
ncbi:MAG: 3-deoxy-manno-octulosonate cytidylyltransferase [Acidobacteria bacterium]|nr:3-deoxy-manno-octulosonate cytidylyltransferase [Acidobacteriota bacterium]